MAAEPDKTESATRIFLCEECENRCESSHRCLACKVFLCRLCTEAHALSETTRDHTLSSLNDSNTTDVIRVVETLGCSKHDNQALTLFCTSCQKASCRLSVEETHRQHSYSYIDNVESKGKDEMRNVLEKLKNIKATLSKRLSDLLENEDRLMATKKSVISKITNYFEELTKVIVKQRDELVGQVTYLTSARSQELEGPREHLKLLLARGESAIEITEQALSSEDDVQILSQKDDVVECLNSMNIAVNKEVPVIDDSIKFVTEYSVKEVHEKVLNRCFVLGDVACPEKSTASFKDTESSLKLRRDCIVTVFCKDKRNKEMTSGRQSVIPIFTGVKVRDVTVRDNNNGSYDIKFTTQEIGTLTFQALINGHPAPSCTLTKKVRWVLREDIGSGTIINGGMTLSADGASGSWWYRIGDCFFDTGINKWKVEVKYLGTRSRFSARKEVEVGVVDTDGDHSSGGMKSGHTNRWTAKFSAEVIVTLKVDMLRNILTVQSSGGVDEINRSIPPAQCVIQIAAKRVSPFLAFRGRHLSLTVIQI